MILTWLFREGHITQPTIQAYDKEAIKCPQFQIRQGKRPKSLEECELAVLEALILQGGINAWNGDGVSCVAQMIWKQCNDG